MCLCHVLVYYWIVFELFYNSQANRYHLVFIIYKILRRHINLFQIILQAFPEKHELLRNMMGLLVSNERFNLFCIICYMLLFISQNFVISFLRAMWQKWKIWGTIWWKMNIYLYLGTFFTFIILCIFYLHFLKFYQIGI